MFFFLNSDTSPSETSMVKSMSAVAVTQRRAVRDGTMGKRSGSVGVDGDWGVRVVGKGSGVSGVGGSGVGDRRCSVCDGSGMGNGYSSVVH